MAGIDNDSLDFIVAAHVIEHTRNPLKAIQRAHDKLKVGGSLVLFVPDKRLTFDSARETTTIEHLAADYQQPSVERDREHYVEFFSKAFVTPPSLLEQRISDAVMMNHDIHFHTWTYDSFRDTVQYVQQTMFRWSDVWSQPPATSDPNANEFYFVLRK